MVYHLYHKHERLVGPWKTLARMQKNVPPSDMGFEVKTTMLSSLHGPSNEINWWARWNLFGWIYTMSGFVYVCQLIGNVVHIPRYPH